MIYVDGIEVTVLEGVIELVFMPVEHASRAGDGFQGRRRLTHELSLPAANQLIAKLVEVVGEQ